MQAVRAEKESGRQLYVASRVASAFDVFSAGQDDALLARVGGHVKEGLAQRVCSGHRGIEFADLEEADLVVRPAGRGGPGPVDNGVHEEEGHPACVGAGQARVSDLGQFPREAVAEVLPLFGCLPSACEVGHGPARDEPPQIAAP